MLKDFIKLHHLDDYSKLLSDEDCEELYNYIMED